MATVGSDAQGLADPLTWVDAARLASQLRDRHPTAQVVYGVPNGGLAVAALTKLGLALSGDDSPMGLRMAYGDRIVVVDDLVDSGRTLRPYADAGLPVDALIRKPTSPDDLAPEAECRSGWVRFPWERDPSPTDAVVRLIQWIGDDPDREGLRDTPDRVCRALREMTVGQQQTAEIALSTVFNEPGDEMVIVRGLRFSSLCEHHMLPFSGRATLGYVPDGRVVGLSKIPRLVNVFAKRLQVQERMTSQIADAFMAVVKPKGVGVVLVAAHSCMGCRGVVQPDGEMITSALRGIMRDDPKARAELLGFSRS